MEYDRRSGKTTRLMEEAVQMLGELPDEYQVIITGPHTKWLKELEREFKDAELADVRFLTIGQIRDGGLRGMRGRLLVDDPQDVTSRDWEFIDMERRLLHSK